MQIQDLMTIPPVTVPSIATVQDCASHMDHEGVGCVLVVDDGRLVGIVTDRDIALRVVARGRSPETRVGAVMTPHPITVRADESVDSVTHMLRRNDVRRLPVMLGDIVVGVVTVDDLLLETCRLQQDLISPVTGEILDPQHQQA
jgi:signal-transduction protein with cAMP-binding, CBS, and nucleotidyltransferase domain